MLKTFRARLVALLAVLILLRFVQGLYVSHQLGIYQQINDASANAAIAGSDQARLYFLSVEIFGAAQIYSNAVLEKDVERKDSAASALQRLIDDLQAMPAFDAAFSQELRDKLVDDRPLIDSYLEGVRALLISPVDAPNAVRDARRAVEMDFERLSLVFDLQLPKVAADIRSQQRDAQATGKNFEQVNVISQILEGLIFTGAAIWFFLVLNKGFRQLEVTINGINAGKLSARSAMRGADELSRIGQILDRLLDERLVAEAARRQENEALNESAITLLGAVIALSDRDLRVRAPVDDNIVGTIASSINQLADETAEALGSVQSLAVQLAQATKETRQQAQEVDKAIVLEQQLLRDMEVTLADTSTQLLEVSGLSQRSAVSADRTARAAAAAQDAVGTTLEGMEQLRQAMGDTEKRFKTLAQRSQEISTAVALINTISERTHVLSLNASIQAAAAGDAGRGFAVVAQEVQRLSDASSKASNEIAAMVGNIQAEANESLVTLSRLVGDVVNQTGLAQSAAQEMHEAQSATAELIAMVGQIAAASEIQQRLAASLRQSIADINHSTEQTSAAMSSQKAWTGTLVEYAQGLRDSVAEFTLDQPAPPTAA